MAAKSKFKLLYAICAVIMFIVFTLGLSACDRERSPYASDNAFEVEISDTADALIFAPKEFNYSYGVIFYVGTLVPPEHYSYLGEALAKQGYLTVIPKIDGNNIFNNYSETEPAFEKYKDVKFFIAGHDFGGGAAVRRASENVDAVGVILYAPLGFARQKFDEDGKLVYDEDGNVVWDNYSISDLSLPTLLLETDDALRTEDAKLTAKQHINITTATEILLADSNSAVFSTATNSASLTQEQIAVQRDSTVSHTLDFLRKVVCG